MADYDLGTARGRIEIDSRGVGASVADANRHMGTLEGSFASAGRGAQTAGLVAVGAAAGIAAGFGVAINAAANFEQKISGIAAVSGATGAELDRIRDKALKLGADTKFSAGEAALAMEELIKAGLSVDDVLNGAADATVNLAAAGEIDLPQAATIAANAMNTFNLAAEDLPRVADLVAGAANASAIDVGEFALAMQQSGAVANLVGLSFDDLSVAIAAMGNAGIKGSDAGTSLKTFLSNLIPTTEKQTGLMRELGLVTEDGSNQFFDAAGNVKSMADIAGTLSGALAGMTNEQKQATLETLFGSDAIRAAAIIADTGAQGFTDLAAAMGEVSAQEVAETRMDNLSGSIEQLKGSVETLLIIIGRPLAEALRVWVDRITGLVNWIGSLDEGTLTMIATIGKMATAFLGTAGAILLVASAIAKVKFVFDLLKLAFATNPFGLILTLLAALGAALYVLYQNSETFRNGVNAAFAAVRDFVMPIIDTIVLGFKALVAAFQEGDVTSDGFVGFMERMGVALRQAWDFIVGIFNEIKAGIAEFMYTLTTGFTEDEGTPIERFALLVRGLWFDYLKPFAEWVARNWKPILAGLGAAFALIISPIGTVVAALIYAYTHFEGFRNVVDTVARAVVTAFKFVKDDVIPILVLIGEKLLWLGGEIIERVVSGFDWLNTNVFPTLYAAGELVAAVIQRIVDVFQILVDIFGGPIMIVLEVLRTGFENVFTVIRAIVEGFINAVVTVWTAFGDNILAAITLIWNGIKLMIETVLGLIRGVIQVVTGLITGDWSKAWEGIKTIVDTIINAIKGIIENVINLIKLVIETFIDAVKVAWQLFWDNLRLVGETAINLVKNTIESVLGILQGIWDTIWGAIGGVVETVWGGITSGIETAINTVKTVVETVLNTLKTIWETIWGSLRDFVDGLWDGMGDTLRAVVNGIISALEGAINAVIRGINAALDGIDRAAGPWVNFGEIPTVRFGRIGSGHEGGIIPGSLGSEQLMMTLAGERIVPIDQEEQLGRFLSEMAPLMSRQLDLLAAGGAGGGGVNISFAFDGVSAADAEAIRETLMSDDVLDNIVVAVRAGAR